MCRVGVVVMDGEWVGPCGGGWGLGGTPLKGLKIPHYNKDIRLYGRRHAPHTTHSLHEGSYERYGHAWHAGRAPNTIQIK